MELVELQQRKVEALVAAELLRQLLQRIREETVHITSRQLADASVQSAFTSTSHKIVNERKAAILLAAQQAEEARLQMERDMKKKRQQEALEAERQRKKKMEDDHRAKIVQQKAEQKAEEERLHQEDRVLQAELEYKKQIDALLTKKSTLKQSKEERRQIFIKA